ncbi:MAG: hypothetical protein Q7S12_01160 [bacterium]|nr:hypothetical protein [bacterium]
MFTVVVLLVVVLVLAITVIRQGQPKRFGLAEAEAAMRFTGDNPETAKAVKGVVVGVLGFQDGVADDVSARVTEDDEASAKRGEDVSNAQAEIAALEAQIADLQEADEEGLARTKHVRSVGKLFA